VNLIYFVRRPFGRYIKLVVFLGRIWNNGRYLPTLVVRTANHEARLVVR
jgi:hypothetical protein